jgi:hypothetical protein
MMEFLMEKGTSTAPKTMAFSYHFKKLYAKLEKR